VGFNLWLPGYLSMPATAGGVGLSATRMAGSSWPCRWACGSARHVRLRERFHRPEKATSYLLAAAALIGVYVSVRAETALLLLGPFVAFFATGHFSGCGAVSAELYPTDMRATAQGFTYNIGRVVSAAAPYTVGALTQTRGFDVALSTTCIAFVLAALMWIWIPETKGRRLE
jgi:hypothetical protein